MSKSLPSQNSPGLQDYGQLAGVLGLSNPGTLPNYYDLLGVSREQANRLTVEVAAAMRADHLRSLTDPALAPSVARVLAEIARAAACLGDAECRRRYDESLAPKLVPLATPDLVPLPYAAEALDPLGIGNPLMGPAKTSPWAQQAEDEAQQRLIWRVSFAGGGVLALLVLAMVTTRLLSKPEQPVAELPAVSEETKPVTVAPPVITPPVAITPEIASTSEPEVAAPVATEVTRPVATEPETTESFPMLELERQPDAPAPEPLDKATLPANPPASPLPSPMEVLNANAQHLPAAVELPTSTNEKQVALLDLAERWVEGFGLALDCGAAEESLTLQPAGGSRWEVYRAKLSSVNEPLAEFVLDGKLLKFRWAPGGPQRGGEHLRNCVLEITGSKHLHGLALRKAVPLAPLKLAFKERRTLVEIPGETLPDRGAVFLEIAACEGFVTSPTVEPADRRASSTVRGAIKLPGWERVEIVYSLGEAASRRVVTFDARMFVNNAESELTFAEVASKAEGIKAGLEKDAILLNRTQAKIAACDAEAAALRNSPLSSPLTAQAEALIREQRLKELNNQVQKSVFTLKRLQKEMPRAKAMLDQAQQLTTEMETISKSARIHYRLVAKGLRHEITLATTQP